MKIQDVPRTTWCSVSKRLDFYGWKFSYRIALSYYKTPTLKLSNEKQHHA
jgi:hypothetical protein